MIEFKLIKLENDNSIQVELLNQSLNVFKLAIIDNTKPCNCGGKTEIEIKVTSDYKYNTLSKWCCINFQLQAEKFLPA